MEVEHSRLVGKVSDLETSCSQTSVELTEEKKKRMEETEMLAKKLAEKSRLAEAQRQKTLDAENEITVTKRKNAATLRELTRELQACKKKLDQQHQQPPQFAVGGSPSKYSSRASSDVSLNKSEDQEHGNHLRPATVNNNNGDQSNGLRSPTFSAAVSNESEENVHKYVHNTPSFIIAKISTRGARQSSFGGENRPPPAPNR